MIRILRPLAIGVFATLAAATAAGQGGWLEVEATAAQPRISVYSQDGTRWDFVDRTAPLVMQLRGRGRCPEDHHMRNAYMCAGLWGDGSCMEPTVNQSNRSFSGDDGREWKVFPLSRQYLAPRLPVASPVELCNQGLEARLAQHGDSARAQILRQGFEVSVPGAYEAWFNLSCEPQKVFFKDWSNMGDSASVPATIVCVGTGGPEPETHRTKPQPHRLKPEAHRTAATPGIKDAEIWINPKTAADYVGPCPAKLHVGGQVAYYVPEEDPVDLHYRYQVRQGRRAFSSPIFKTRYDQGGRKNLHGWTFEVAPAEAAAGGLAAPDVKGSPVLDGEIELVVLGNVPGARSPTTSFHVTCRSSDPPLAGGPLAAEPAPSSPGTSRRMAAAARFGGWRVALPIRATGRTGLTVGNYVVEVPTQTLAPGDEITVVLYPAPGSLPAGTAPPRVPVVKVAKVDALKVGMKLAKSRVLSDGELEIQVTAPEECGCVLTGVVEAAPR